MARILENYSLNLMKEEGIPVVKFGVAKTPEEAAALQNSLGGEVVVKALVPVGKRGKAGAVKFAASQEEAKEKAAELLSMTLGNYPVNKLLVAEKVKSAMEMYVSITIDHNTCCPVLVFSLSGGIDIEEVAAKDPDKIVTLRINPLKGISSHDVIGLLEDAGMTGTSIRKVSEALIKIYSVFIKTDATLVEINPLFLTNDGNVIVPACVLRVDDAALFRQKELSLIANEGSERAWRPLTEREQRVQAIQDADPYRGTARYTEMENGDIGFMCGGGGGSLVLFDDLLAAGGKPTNYTEFGGNPPEDKVYGLALNILSKPGTRGLFVAHNITNNTQVDVEARGIVRAIKELAIDPAKFPIVVRMPGVNEAEGQKVLEEAGIKFYGDEITMTGAAKKMVEKLNEMYGKQGGKN